MKRENIRRKGKLKTFGISTSSKLAFFGSFPPVSLVFLSSDVIICISDM